MDKHTARYVTRFACLTADCPDNCCTGLTISLTEEEVVRLERGPGTAAWKAAMAREVQPPPPGAPEGTYRVLAHGDGPCAFLDDDKLCTVHKAIGADGLNATCRDYPRQSATVGDRVEVWGALGCPEMARLALTAPDALELVTVQDAPRPRLELPEDASREGVLALLRDDDKPLSLRFAGVALALDAAESAADVAATTEALRADATEFAQTLSGVAPDAVLRAVVGRDLLMARRPMSHHAQMKAATDAVVFTSPPSAHDVDAFFVARTDTTRADLDVVQAVVAQSAHHEDETWALAVSRYAGWRWASRPPADLAAARLLWGRILVEVAAADLLASTGVDVVEALRLIAREVVSVPDLDVLLDRYVAEQGLDGLHAQVAARPGPASMGEEACDAEAPAAPPA